MCWNMLVNIWYKIVDRIHVFVDRIHMLYIEYGPLFGPDSVYILNPGLILLFLLYFIIYLSLLSANCRVYISTWGIFMVGSFAWKCESLQQCEMAQPLLVLRTSMTQTLQPGSGVVNVVAVETAWRYYWVH